ncbi:MAG: leucine-rich repeat protein, partial [Candidatus Methanomethylophilaceae archaeon]|nr:leucine-rich repeat protein [Candidatus Methanomethylophilaceae archaeon]
MTGDFTVPNGVTGIDNLAFQNCSALTSVTMISGVSSIDFSAFYGCSSLITVTMPESVTFIGWNAFTGCSSLTSVTVPIGITSIESRTFQGCSSLTSVTMLGNIVSIGDHAFSECSSLVSISLPANLGSLGEEAFYGCSSLTSVTIPSSVTSIGAGAFRNCTSMVAIDVDGSNADYMSYDGVLYSKSGEDLIQCPAGKSEVDVPDTVTTIKSGAFSLSSIGFITMPGSVTSIEGGAFSVSSLTSVTIPANVASVSGFAFSNCHALKSVYILGNATLIENYAFNNCSSLMSVVVPDHISPMGEYAFSSCDNLILLGILGSTETDYSNLIANFPSTIDSVIFRSGAQVDLDTIASLYHVQYIGVLDSSEDPDMGGQIFSDPEGTVITDTGSLKSKMFVKTDGWHQIPTCSDPNVIYRINGTVAEAVGLIDRSASYAIMDEYHSRGGVDYTIASISESAFRGSSLSGIGFLGLVAPTSVGDHWIADIASGITGHARSESDFPLFGDSYHGLPMVEPLAIAPAAVRDLIYDGSEQTGVLPGTEYTIFGNTGTNAGTYEATANLVPGYIWSDGTTSDRSISWRMAKAPLIVIADDKSATYSSDPPVYTISCMGLVDGETIDVINGGTVTSSYSKWDDIGSYQITAAGYTADNYEISYVEGRLTIGEHSIEVPDAEAGLEYTGSEHTGVLSGTGYTLSGSTGTNAGTYEATANLVPGYIWSDGNTEAKTIDWNISKAVYDMSGVTWSADSFVYDGSDKTVLVFGLPSGITVSTYMGNIGMIVGNYSADVILIYDSVNYNQPMVEVHEWSITPANQTVSAEGYTGIYDGSAHTIAVTQDGGTASFSTNNADWTETAPSFTDAGTYIIHLKVVKSNHYDHIASLVVEISKAPLTVIAENKSIIFGSDSPFYTISYEGFVGVEDEGSITAGT